MYRIDNYSLFCSIFLNVYISVLILFKDYLEYVFLFSLIAILVVFLFVRFNKKDILKKSGLFVVVFLSFLLYFRLISNTNKDLGLRKCNMVCGNLVADSTITKNGATIFNVHVYKEFSDDISIERCDVISIMVDNQKTRGVYSEKWQFSGLKRIESGFYSAKSAICLSENLITGIRRKFLVNSEDKILNLNKYLDSDEDYNCHALSLKLFMAREASVGDVVSNLSKKCGLEYIFALSGMHLSLFALVFGKIFSLFLTKKQSKFFSLIVISAYFFIVSRAPSFIRAYLMFLLSFIFPSFLCLPVSFILQLILFPFSCFSLGFDYSYIAVCGIYLFYRFFYYLLSSFLGKRIASYFALSFSAIILSALISLMNFGVFKLIGVLIAPLVSFIAGIMLCFGLIFLFFSDSFIFSFSNRVLYRLLVFLLEKISLISFDCNIWGYFAIVFVFCIMVAVVKGNTKNLKTYVWK